MILTKPYQLLQQQYQIMKQTSLLDLFKNDVNRFEKFNLKLNDFVFDFSKNNITEETLNILVKLANECKLLEHIDSMFQGKKINNTENRAVLHVALRDKNKEIYVDNINISKDINIVLEKMKNFSLKIHNNQHLGYTKKPIKDIVNIGIGGSDLGPTLVCQALKPYRKNNLNIHFISSVDGFQIYDILSELNPETTLFIIASKTFTTQETMINAQTARKWFLNQAKDIKNIKYHFVAASTNMQAVEDFGIDRENIFYFWDFVGGRYSLFSAIGLSIILYIGFDNFHEMQSGAHNMDMHFLQTKDFRKNLPVVMALISIWYNNFFNYSTQVISPYNTRLTKFPAYVQQLEMESNGKSVDREGNILPYKTSPVIWGDSGINAQHAYYQLLHQGTNIFPMDIIISLSDKFSDKEHNDALIANAFAQSEAFLTGKSFEVALVELIANGIDEEKAKFLAKHKTFKGNRPTNMIVMPEISPYYLGMLIALYEHKTFTEGVIWNINSFDQMGVELGKQLTKTILHDIATKTISFHDDSTTNLIKLYINKAI